MEHEGAAHRVRRLALDDERPGLAVVRDARSIDDASHLRGQCGAEVPAEAIGHLRELLGSPSNWKTWAVESTRLRRASVARASSSRSADAEARTASSGPAAARKAVASTVTPRTVSGSRSTRRPAQPEGQRGEGRHRASLSYPARSHPDPPAAAPAPGLRP